MASHRRHSRRLLARFLIALFALTFAATPRAQDSAEPLARAVLDDLAAGSFDPMFDFAGWKRALEGRSTAAFRSFPRLNHLFLEGAGSGRSLPAEYRMPGHIPEEVITEVAAWINAPPKR